MLSWSCFAGLWILLVSREYFERAQARDWRHAAALTALQGLQEDTAELGYWATFKRSVPNAAQFDGRLLLAALTPGRWIKDKAYTKGAIVRIKKKVHAVAGMYIDHAHSFTSAGLVRASPTPRTGSSTCSTS